MSLNISRRDFFKLSAVTAMAVAGSGMLTACQDPNNPTRKGVGTLNVSQVYAELKSFSTASGVTATFEITNKADNPISITAANFSVYVGGVEYNSSSSPAVTISGATNKLEKKDKTTVVVSLSGVAGSSVEVVYWPRLAYTELSMGWTLA